MRKMAGLPLSTLPMLKVDPWGPCGWAAAGGADMRPASGGAVSTLAEGPPLPEGALRDGRACSAEHMARVTCCSARHRRRTGCVRHATLLTVSTPDTLLNTPPPPLCLPPSRRPGAGDTPGAP